MLHTILDLNYVDIRTHIIYIIIEHVYIYIYICDDDLYCLENKPTTYIYIYIYIYI